MYRKKQLHLAIAIASEHLRPILPGENAAGGAGKVPDGLNDLITRAWAPVESSRPRMPEITRELEAVVAAYCAIRRSSCCV